MLIARMASWAKHKLAICKVSCMACCSVWSAAIRPMPDWAVTKADLKKSSSLKFLIGVVKCYGLLMEYGALEMNVNFI